jgi:hypothetical protein
MSDGTAPARPNRLRDLAVGALRRRHDWPVGSYGRAQQVLLARQFLMALKWRQRRSG